MTRKLIASLIVAAAFLGLPATAFANEYAPALQKLIDGDLRAWAQSDEVVAAVKEQNKKSAALSQGDIDGQDKQWREETKGGNKAMINAVLSNSLSAYLKSVKEKSQGLYTEIFVMDMKGLNVGQSDITSDYWQGDEAKWQKTFGAGPTAVMIDEVEFDDSSQTYQSQISVTIVDTASNTAIGAVTVGVNVEMLN